MGGPGDTPDPRYAAGIALFNAGEYFEAHEVWEDLWHERGPADRRFYQALIQAAVALYHHGRGNAPGAARLCASGRSYMGPFRPVYMGLAVDEFWAAVGARLAGTGGPPAITLRASDR